MESSFDQFVTETGLVDVDSRSGPRTLARYLEKNLERAVFRASEAPSLAVYTLSLWGSEVWVHHGVRDTGSIGYLIGTNRGSNFQMRIRLSASQEEELIGQ